MTNTIGIAVSVRYSTHVKSLYTSSCQETPRQSQPSSLLRSVQKMSQNLFKLTGFAKLFLEYR